MEINEHGVIIDGYKIRKEQLDKKCSFEINIIKHENKRYGIDNCTGTDRGHSSGLSLKDHNAEDLKILLLDLMRDVFKTFKDHEADNAMLNKIIEIGKGIGASMIDEATILEAKFVDYIKADDPSVQAREDWINQQAKPTEQIPVTTELPQDSEPSKPRKSRSKKVQASEASEAPPVPSTPAPEFTEGMEIKCINPGIFGKLQLDKVYKAEELITIHHKGSTIYMYKIKLGLGEIAQFNAEYFTPL